MFEAGDLQGGPFQRAYFKKGTVQIRYIAEFGPYIAGPFALLAGQRLEEQLLQLVIILDPVSVQKGISYGSLIPGDQTAFQQLEKQYPVQPGDAEFQGNAEILTFLLSAVILQIVYSFQRLLHLEQIDGVLQQRAFITPFRSLAANQFFTLFLYLFQTDDMQQLAVKFAVEVVTVSTFAETKTM